MEFKDKHVVVTGAAGIFGRWIAAYFAREGARLCLSDVREEALAEAARTLGMPDDRLLLHPTELTDDASIADLVSLVKQRWGAPDIVVNNAGIYPRSKLMEISFDDWDAIFGINLRAPFVVSREMARLMIAERRQGAIVNISSGAARRMTNTSAPYCISKTALERLSKGLALELAPHGIRVNVVEPGFAPGSSVSRLNDDYVARMMKGIPLGRSSGPEDAPAAIAFLCSDKAPFITGAVLSVDGGNSIGTFTPPEPAVPGGENA
jgi:3-oxoacyl-[acyl-carrier protein] reductase